MKNFFISLILMAICFWCLWFDTYYERPAKVIEIDNEIITVQDTCGNIWSFKGHDFSINENIILRMDSNHTDYIYDDIIVKVIRKS